MKPESILGLLESLRTDALGRPVDLPVTVACPPEPRILELAAGLIDGESAESLIRHAAQCDHCGGLLRRSLDDFSREASPEEQLFVASIRSEPLALPARRQPNVATIRPAAATTAAPWRWVAAAAAAAFLIVGAWWTFKPVPAETLLASTYTANRPFEARFPDAAWAPPSAQRSAQSASATLAEAQLQIRDQLAVKPRDARWLELKGRAEILAADFDRAVDSLHQSLAAHPNSVSVLVYLAIAESQRGVDDPSAYTRALKHLTRAIQIDPSNSPAYFNRALIQEKLNQPALAKKDWEKVVALESSGPWVDEARRHLAR